ncbi:hypothetical protein PR048_031578 [Dryococelus australis]|uniref:Uncharacterized protein n=1 Tax=Dryococelus australis TaxID=614101 RepID=A0ABQ9G5P9_9NEOP|nr:hypothetical protein PR048_031578 [Dryococelus australis]
MKISRPRANLLPVHDPVRPGRVKFVYCSNSHVRFTLIGSRDLSFARSRIHSILDYLLAVRLIASHQGEPGSIPSRASPGFSQVGIVPDDAAGRRVFSLLASQQCEPGSIPGRFTPDFCKWESWQAIPLVGGFSRDLPFSTAPSLRRCSIPQSPSSALNTSLVASAKIPSFASCSTVMRPISTSCAESRGDRKSAEGKYFRFLRPRECLGDDQTSFKPLPCQHKLKGERTAEVRIVTRNQNRDSSRVAKGPRSGYIGGNATPEIIPLGPLWLWPSAVEGKNAEGLWARGTCWPTTAHYELTVCARITKGIARGFPLVRIVPDNAVGRRVFSEVSRFPKSLHSDAAPLPPCFALIGFQDPDVKSRPDLFTLHSGYAIIVFGGRGRVVPVVDRVLARLQGIIDWGSFHPQLASDSKMRREINLTRITFLYLLTGAEQCSSFAITNVKPDDEGQSALWTEQRGTRNFIRSSPLG